MDKIKQDEWLFNIPVLLFTEYRISVVAIISNLIYVDRI